MSIRINNALGATQKPSPYNAAFTASLSANNDDAQVKPKPKKPNKKAETQKPQSDEQVVAPKKPKKGMSPQEIFTGQDESDTDSPKGNTTRPSNNTPNKPTKGMTVEEIFTGQPAGSDTENPKGGSTPPSEIIYIAKTPKDDKKDKCEKEEYVPVDTQNFPGSSDVDKP